MMTTFYNTKHATEPGRPDITYPHEASEVMETKEDLRHVVSMYVGNEVSLWPSAPPHEVIIPTDLRHKLYPRPPLRDDETEVNKWPSMRPYLIVSPSTGSPLLRPAVLIFPGGGYGLLSNTEAARAVTFLNERAGVHAVVVRYRVQRRHPAPLLDARRAMQLVRTVYSSAWGIDVAAVGVMGFSAGGHLAGHLSVAWDGPDGVAADEEMRVQDTEAPTAASARPDVAVLCYPVVSGSGTQAVLANATLKAPRGVRVGGSGGGGTSSEAREGSDSAWPAHKRPHGLRGAVSNPFQLTPLQQYSIVGERASGSRGQLPQPVRHHGSMVVLLGDRLDDAEAQAEVSIDQLVLHRASRSVGADADATPQPLAPPPFFIWSHADDLVVPAANTLLLASALQRSAVPLELHLFERGGYHGFGSEMLLGAREKQTTNISTLLEGYNRRDKNGAVSPELHRWPDLVLSWLSARGSKWASAIEDAKAFEIETEGQKHESTTDQTSTTS